MDFIPDKSEIQLENIDTKDAAVRNLIKELGIRKLIPGLQGKGGPRRDQ